MSTIFKEKQEEADKKTKTESPSAQTNKARKWNVFLKREATVVRLD